MLNRVLNVRRSQVGRRATGLVLAAGLAVSALLVSPALAAGPTADRLTKKDGTVLVGKVVQQSADLVVIVVIENGRERRIALLPEDVARVEKDAVSTPAPAEKPADVKPADAKPAETKPADAKAADTKPATGAAAASTKPAEPTKGDWLLDRPLTGRPTRIAVLHFGLPSSERMQVSRGDVKGKMEDTVGIQVSHKYFEAVLPILERENVDVVVIRINSGGGYLLEMQPLQKSFHEKFKSRFRTVGWVESAISAAAMSPWPLEEFYMQTNGNIGGCTGYSGRLNAIKGIELLDILKVMEDVSKLAGRDPKIMRSMQIQEPLTANFNPDGSVNLLNDSTGRWTINRPGQVLTATTDQTIIMGFAQGVADTVPELAKAMGIGEYELVAIDATKMVDQLSRAAQDAQDNAQRTFQTYGLAIQEAQAGVTPSIRAAAAGRAMGILAQLEAAIKLNPNFEFALGGELSKEWFQQQRDMIRRILDANRRPAR